MESFELRDIERLIAMVISDPYDSVNDDLLLGIMLVLNRLNYTYEIDKNWKPAGVRVYRVRS